MLIKLKYSKKLRILILILFYFSIILYLKSIIFNFQWKSSSASTRSSYYWYQSTNNSSSTSTIFTHSMWTITSTTIITKLMSTSTRHSTTSLCPFNPIFTFRALFKFSTSNKLLKFTIIFTITMTDSILSTTHSMMILTSTT